MDTLKENTPPPLSATQERPDKDEAIESYVSRYARREIVH